MSQLDRKKNGKLIQFDPKTDPELFEIVDVSFDKSNIYKIKIHDGLEKKCVTG